MRPLAAFLGALLIAGCGPEGASRIREAPRVGPLPVGATALRDDPEDRDQRLRRQSRSAVAARPALQHLPMVTPELSIEIAGATAGGRLVLLVRSVRGEAAARAGYRDFLRRLGDDGRSYLSTFRPTG